MIKTVVNDFKPNKPSPSLWTKIGNCARELLPFQCDEATEELAIFVIVNDIIDPMDMYRFLIAEEKTEFFHIVHLEDKVREDLKSVGALSQEVLKLPETSALKKRLWPQLEILDALKSEDLEAVWVKSVVNSFPTVSDLKRATWNDVETKLSICPPRALDTIKKIHMEGHKLREQFDAAGLDASLADMVIAADSSVRDLEALTGDDRDNLIEKLPKNLQFKVGRAINLHNPTWKAKREEASMNRDVTRKKVLEAKTALMKAQKEFNDQGRAHAVAAGNAGALLQQKVAERIKSDIANIREKLEVPKDLRLQDMNIEDELGTLNALAQEASSAVESFGDNRKSLEEIVNSASGGLARKGVVIVGDDLAEAERVPTGFLFSEIPYVIELGCHVHAKDTSYSTVDSRIASSFEKVVSSKGLNFAVSGSFEGWGACASAACANASEQQSERTRLDRISSKSMVKFDVSFVPIQSFKIPK